MKVPKPPKTRIERISPRTITVKSDTKAKQDKYLLNISNYEIFLKPKRSALSIINFVKDKRTNKKYAAKTSLEPLDPQQQIFILREINILMQIQHPTIVHFEGVSFQDFEKVDSITIFMEYLENGSLADMIEKESLSLLNPEYDNTTRQIILVGIAYGMNLLHKSNVIHRDLKPENILIDRDFKPHITDFGLSKFFNPMYSKNQSISTIGTIQYMAPEVIRDEPFNTKADVYAFGIIMYEVLTGNRAYKDVLKKSSFTMIESFKFLQSVAAGKRPKFDERCKLIKDEIKELIKQCWADDPNDRPTFSEVYKKLSLSEKDFVTKYCLDKVDLDRLGLYIDEITNESTIDESDNEYQTELLKKEMEELENKNEELTEANSQLKRCVLQLKADNSELSRHNMKLNS